jgi:hypothetical protein
MAVGQLLDYERFVSPRPRRRAVLVPKRPTDDLVALLDSLDIGLIWQSGKGFRHNRRGSLI